MIPRATPVAAPAIKARMVTLVMEGVLPANRKPATAIHKVQRTMRMFIKRTPDYESICLRVDLCEPVTAFASPARQRPRSPDPRRFNDPHPEQSLNDKTLSCFIACAKQPSWVGRASRMVQ